MLSRSKSNAVVDPRDRVLYCERRDAFDAKNRYGMREHLDIPADPAQIWPTIWDAITEKKEKS